MHFRQKTKTKTKSKIAAKINTECVRVLGCWGSGKGVSSKCELGVLGEEVLLKETSLRLILEDREERPALTAFGSLFRRRRSSRTHTHTHTHTHIHTLPTNTRTPLRH